MSVGFQPSARILVVSRKMKGLSPILDYTGGDRGWIGDSPFIFLDTSRIRALGWKPKLTIREGVLRTRAGMVKLLI